MIFWVMAIDSHSSECERFLRFKWSYFRKILYITIVYIYKFGM